MEHIVEPATKEDAVLIARQLRKDDVREIVAASGKSPLNVLHSSVNWTTYVWRYGTQYVAIFGCDPVGPGVGSPWMVATDAIEQHPIFFLRHCKNVIRQWSDRYPRLTNCVDARNELHIKWLKWAGFTFTKLHPEWGAAKLPFWQFEKVTNV